MGRLRRILVMWPKRNYHCI